MPTLPVNKGTVNAAQQAAGRGIFEEIDFTNITIPAADPYSPAQPEKQRENLAYVELQIYAVYKTQRAAEQAEVDSLWPAQNSVISAQSNLCNVLRPLVSVEWQTLLDQITLENSKLLLLTSNETHYDRRAAILMLHETQIQTMILHEKLSDLNYAGTLLDVDGVLRVERHGNTLTFQV